jgi:hypothetical protein
MAREMVKRSSVLDVVQLAGLLVCEQLVRDATMYIHSFRGSQSRLPLILFHSSIHFPMSYRCIYIAAYLMRIYVMPVSDLRLLRLA